VRKEIAGLLDSVRRRGVGTSLRLLAGELCFDAWFGTETRAVLEGPELGTLVRAADNGRAIYHAINPVVFARAIGQLQALAPDALSHGSFVDFGSGKGRALILAARAGFPRVTGIEWSPVLHALCRRNVEAAWQRRTLCAEHELHLGDAARFDVPDDSTVWFWFNPFDAAMSERVATNLRDSLERRPRPAYLIYARPVHAGLLTAQGFRVAAEVRLARDYVDALILQHRLAAA
jgi:SAM-dependent methyltransferase